MLLVAMSSILIACSPGVEKKTQHAGEDVGQVTAHEETMSPAERTEAAPASEDEGTTTDSRVRWDYVALGDSLAAGVGARRGYVARYAQHLQRDTGARVRVINLGVSGQTSTQLLHAIRHDPATRKALGRAEVVTLNIGLNDLGQATASYESGTCGGQQNEACLREAVAGVEGNWDAIIEEILSLRSTEDTIIRSAGLGYTPRVGRVFEPYLTRIILHVASAAAQGDIPYVEIHLGSAGISEDGLHPNDKGYGLIADRLAELGYAPLDAR
jgi:lysophospholipase L1-like esterase